MFLLLIRTCLFDCNRTSGLCFKHAQKNRSFFSTSSVPSQFILTELESLKNDIVKVNYAKIRASYVEVDASAESSEFLPVPVYGGGFVHWTPIFVSNKRSNGFNFNISRIYDSNLKLRIHVYELGGDVNSE